MRTARYVELCFLYLGTLSLVHFALAVQARWTIYNLVPLLGGLTFLAFVVENRLGSDEPDWPKKVVYLVSLVAVAYTVLFLGILVAAYFPRYVPW
jgi:hypothetical protein